MNGHSSSFRAAATCLLAFGLSGCIGPAGGKPAGSGAAGGEASPTAAPTVGPNGKALVWDGEGIGSSAKSWASCKSPGCKTALAALPGVGHAGSSGLRFHAEGSDWLGGGWNLFGWWPANSGINVSSFKNLSFWCKVEAKSPAEAPDPGSLSAVLGASTGQKESSDVLLAKYDAKLFDGDWHELVIPLADFLKGKGGGFDLRSIWELRFSHWSGEPKNFSLYIDDIGFDNR